MAAQNPALFETETGLYTLMGQVYDSVLSNSSLILLIAAAITVLVLTIFFRARGKRLTRETWLLPVRVQSLWPVVLAGAALAVVISYGFSLIPWPDHILESYEAHYAVSNDGSVLTMFVTILVAPFLEELIFRGLAFTRFCRGMPAPAALILAATIFGAMHGTLLWASYGFICGVAITLVFMKYRSLYAAMLMHAVFNLFGGYLIGYLSFSSPYYDFALLGAALAVLAGLGVYMYRMPRSRIDRAPSAQPPQTL